MPRSLSMCGHVVANALTMVVPDVARDLRFAGNPALAAKGVRFYAGAPLGSASGHLLGSLCLLDLQPRMMSEREVKLLEAMADDLVASLHQQSLDWQGKVPADDTQQAASAIVGQPVAAG